MTNLMYKLPLDVSCPTCGKTKTLTSQRLGAEKFVPETCDGKYGARHQLAIMVGPKGSPNA